MKVVVDYDRCEGHARCKATAPEVFDVQEDQVILLSPEPGEDLRAKVERAVRLCPRQALTLEG